jgi:alpha-glucosidase
VNANKNACDYKVETLQVNNSTSLPIHLASGGGFAIRLIKK